MQDEAGIPDDKKIPCAGEGVNGHLVQMLPAATKVDGATGTYRPMGYPSVSYDAKPYGGALAFKHAVEVLEGKPLSKDIKLPLPFLTNTDIILCKTGSWKEWKETGCNAFPPTLVPDPTWFPEIFHEELPEIGLKAAMNGTPEF
jgi:ribose transport system substrate-binding protein